MAAEGEAVGAAGKGLAGSLKTKIGPLPIGVWAVIGAGMWWFLQQRKKAAPGAGGQQIDSAGNVGTIDPTTGYVAGSPQDTAALGQAGSGGGGGGDTSPSAGSGSTTAGQYATNDDWSRAALNYLVGIGVDPTVAGQAIQQYLASQPLTTIQHGDVNLAIQALGSPPTLPPPSQTNPTPVSTPPTGTVNATNPVTGVRVLPVNTSRSTLAVGWNKAANATGYNVSIGTDAAGSNHQTQTVPARYLQTTFGSLAPHTTYHMRVQATPAAPGAPWSRVVTGTTAK